MIVTPADEVAVQALYRVESVQQRLAVNLPPDAKFDAQPLRVGGQPVQLQGKDGKYSVPLLAGNTDEPVLLELRYTVPFKESRLELPTFPEGAAVQKVYLCVYLPATQALLGSVGPWSQESSESAKALRSGNRPRWRRSVDSLGPEGDRLGGKSGRVVPARRDAVRLLRDTAGGAARRLAPTPLVERVRSKRDHIPGRRAGGRGLAADRPGPPRLAVGAVIVALVLAGVFFPTLSTQILHGVLRPGHLHRAGGLGRGLRGMDSPGHPGPAASGRGRGPSAASGGHEGGRPGAGTRPPPQAAAEPAPKPESEGGQTHA